MRRGVGRALLPSVLMLLASCGYVGGPMPPLINIPTPVHDLAAVERGGLVIAQFTIPLRTTEGELIKEPLTLDLRIGTAGEPFNPDQWAAQATQVKPPANAKGIARYEIPTSPWIGKETVIGVRTVGSNGKESAWSNYAVVQVVAAPSPPHDVRGESTATGTRLTWQGSGDHFRVFRKGASEPQYSVIAPDLPTPEFVDTTAAIGVEYSYMLQSFVPQGDNKEAQSDLSPEFKFTRQPPLPATPSGLLAVTAANSIELSWNGNVDEQTVGYRIYRAAPGADFTKLADGGAIPSYSDRAAEHGKTYRYAVSALDKEGRESPRSAPVEVSFQ